jgi:hypothetical protein
MVRAIQNKVAEITSATQANGGIIPAAWQPIINDIIAALQCLEIFIPAAWQADVNAIFAAIKALESASANAVAKLTAQAKLVAPAVVTSTVAQ